MNLDRKEFEELKSDIRAIKIAVIGDEQIGATGLVKRVAKLEKRERRRELRWATLTGAMIGAVEGIKHFFAKNH
ncbi:MAG TPA: hypothetical protein VHG89_04855 [Verrucomicrobiae bacterium]|nr:hypothetical protein [Verrucomicrobiae bacterium]